MKIGEIAMKEIGTGRIKRAIVPIGISLLMICILTACAHQQRPKRNLAMTTATIQGLKISSVGDPKNPPIIFLHGGPGFNSVDFEVSTAQKLAERGFYVLSYDQRGQGRNASSGSGKSFTYRKYSEDLLAIVRELKLRQPILIGHSHGGAIAIEFQENFPKVARGIVLVGSPVDFWKSIQTMAKNCIDRYTEQNRVDFADDVKKNFDALNAYRTGQADLVSPLAKLYGHGLFGCRLYQTKSPTKEELELRSLVATHSSPMEQNSMPGFLINESYIYRNFFPKLNRHERLYFGIYGSEDGLFSEGDREEIAKTIGKPRFRIIQGASHAIFLDQQKDFLNTIEDFQKMMPTWRASK